MFRKFLICVAPSEAHTFHMVDQLRAGGFSNTRIRAFLGFDRSPLETFSSLDVAGEEQWATTGACGSFSDLGFPDLEAQRYEQMLRAGRIVICVQTDAPEEMEDVMQIFEEARGEEISSVADIGHRRVFTEYVPLV
ncbi:MAG: hypothetical protein JNN07_17140 [Verrucomicrobiales bacterium]|nr:hypothetical protein [Verrucomicrobiales bacterium]